MNRPKAQAPSPNSTTAASASVAGTFGGDAGLWSVEQTATELKDEPPQAVDQHPWDLEQRVTLFGERIVKFSKTIPRDPTNTRLIDQLVGAGTSLGANYCEANEAVSPKDFRNTLGRCLKEAKETKFFLRMVVASEPQLADEARLLYREAHELLRIFGSMRKRVRTD